MRPLLPDCSDEDHAPLLEQEAGGPLDRMPMEQGARRRQEPDL